MLEKLQKIIADLLDVEIKEITLEASIANDLGADSLDIVELVIAIEEEFNLEIPDEDAEKIKTVQDIINYIEAAK